MFSHPICQTTDEQLALLSADFGVTGSVNTATSIFTTFYIKH